MKFFVPCVALATLVAAAEQVDSPIFLLSSTANLDLAHIPDYSPVDMIHRSFSHAVSSCPTKNYIVAYQPGVTIEDFESSYLHIGSHAHTNLVVEGIQGNVDVVAVVNTILMDCLHAPEGVKRVESLDTSRLEVSHFEEDLIKKSIMHIPFRSLSHVSGTSERAALLEERDTYLKTVISKYFGNKDYTLIYITTTSSDAEEEALESVNDGTRLLDGAEVPFVLEDEQ